MLAERHLGGRASPGVAAGRAVVLDALTTWPRRSCRRRADGRGWPRARSDAAADELDAIARLARRREASRDRGSGRAHGPRPRARRRRRARRRARTPPAGADRRGRRTHAAAARGRSTTRRSPRAPTTCARSGAAPRDSRHGAPMPPARGRHAVGVVAPDLGPPTSPRLPPGPGHRAWRRRDHRARRDRRPLARASRWSSRWGGAAGDPADGDAAGRRRRRGPRSRRSDAGAVREAAAGDGGSRTGARATRASATPPRSRPTAARARARERGQRRRGRRGWRRAPRASGCSAPSWPSWTRRTGRPRRSTGARCAGARAGSRADGDRARARLRRRQDAAVPGRTRRSRGIALLLGAPTPLRRSCGRSSAARRLPTCACCCRWSRRAQLAAARASWPSAPRAHRGLRPAAIGAMIETPAAASPARRRSPRAPTSSASARTTSRTRRLGVRPVPARATPRARPARAAQRRTPSRRARAGRRRSRSAARPPPTRSRCRCSSGWASTS